MTNSNQGAVQKATSSNFNADRRITILDSSQLSSFEELTHPIITFFNQSIQSIKNNPTLAIIVFTDILLSLMEFGLYRYEHAPWQLIFAKVCAAIIKYPCYFGFCLFACRNINSFLFRQAGPTMRLMLQNREQVHKILGLQAIMAGIGHIFSHIWLYCDQIEDFHMPVVVSGALLMLTMLSLPASYLLHSCFNKISYGKFENTHKILAAIGLVIYLFHIGFPNIDKSWAGISEHVTEWIRIFSWMAAAVVVVDNGYSMLKRKTEKVTVERVCNNIVKVTVKSLKNLHPGSYVLLRLNSHLKPFSVGYNGQILVQINKGETTKFVNSIEKNQKKEMDMEMEGPYNKILSTIYKSTKAAIVVAGVGLSFANSYMAYLIQKNPKVSLYLVIKLPIKEINLLHKTGTLALISTIIENYENNTLSTEINIHFMISGTKEQEEKYNNKSSKLKDYIYNMGKGKGKISDRKNVTDQFCISGDRNPDNDYKLIEKIYEFDKKTKNKYTQTMIDIYYCGNPEWSASLKKETNKFSIPYVSEAYGSKNKKKRTNKANNDTPDQEGGATDDHVNREPITIQKSCSVLTLTKSMSSLELEQPEPPLDQSSSSTSVDKFNQQIQKNAATYGIHFEKSDRFNARWDVSDDTSWFTDDEINKLLEYFYGNKPNIRLIASIDVEQHDGEVLIKNLEEIQLQQTLEASISGADGYQQDTIIVPINLGGRHWAALYIHFNTEDRTSPIVNYFDPLGNKMPFKLKDILTTIYFGLNEENVMQSPIKFQYDGYNCGPWTIAILNSLLNHGAVPDEKMFNIDGAKQMYRDILRQIEIPHHNLFSTGTIRPPTPFICTAFNQLTITENRGREPKRRSKSCLF